MDEEIWMRIVIKIMKPTSHVVRYGWYWVGRGPQGVRLNWGKGWVKKQVQQATRFLRGYKLKLNFFI